MTLDPATAALLAELPETAEDDIPAEAPPLGEAQDEPDTVELGDEHAE